MEYENNKNKQANNNSIKLNINNKSTKKFLY